MKAKIKINNVDLEVEGTPQEIADLVKQSQPSLPIQNPKPQVDPFDLSPEFKKFLEDLKKLNPPIPCHPWERDSERYWPTSPKITWIITPTTTNQYWQESDIGKVICQNSTL